MQLKNKKQQISQPSVNEEVLELVSLELAIPKDKVKEVVKVQSDYTVEKIKEGGFDGVLWPLFGKVKVKIRKVHKYHEVLGGTEVRKNTEVNK